MLGLSILYAGSSIGAGPTIWSTIAPFTAATCSKWIFRNLFLFQRYIPWGRLTGMFKVRDTTDIIPGTGELVGDFSAPSYGWGDQAFLLTNSAGQLKGIYSTQNWAFSSAMVKVGDVNPSGGTFTSFGGISFFGGTSAASNKWSFKAATDLTKGGISGPAVTSVVADPSTIVPGTASTHFTTFGSPSFTVAFNSGLPIISFVAHNTSGGQGLYVLANSHALATLPIT